MSREDYEWSDADDLPGLNPENDTASDTDSEGDYETDEAGSVADESDQAHASITAALSRVQQQQQQLQLGRVAVLDLSYNRLETLPRAFFWGLPRLQVLDLSYNRLRSVSGHVARLTRLQHLSLAGNPLAWLPAEIRRLPSLAALDVHGLPWRPLRADIDIESDADADADADANADAEPHKGRYAVPSLRDLCLTRCLRSPPCLASLPAAHAAVLAHVAHWLAPQTAACLACRRPLVASCIAVAYRTAVVAGKRLVLRYRTCRSPLCVGIDADIDADADADADANADSRLRYWVAL